MKCVVCVIAVVALSYIYVAESGVWRGVRFDKTERNQCKINDFMFLYYNQEYHPPRSCEKVICTKNRRSELTVYNCDERVVWGCEDAGYVNISKNYPECCLRKFICKRDGKEKIIEI
ncbi:unnamed protein product [Hermetia illucens]|uniref:Single domain-containing protein n=1 Tax=Hermetia illucens TaxID=343691 RepID=A0A7R8UW17_HERIL|nr:uncharacterized protein LOC119655188 isoform X1 [Hermetia illucens]CAD7087674.1 unnamed protein product [Hermetia illucens]